MKDNGSKESFHRPGTSGQIPAAENRSWWITIESAINF